MPRRWATETRAWAYRFLCLRDGEICQVCHRSPTTFYSLDIDHSDGNPKNNRESNLRLLCRSCNVSQENHRLAKSRSVQGERESSWTRVVKLSVPYRDGSPEMQANLLFEIDFRAWLIQHISKYEFISKKEAINSGAEVVGCNPTTSAKYLAKLTSQRGPLAEMKDMLGDLVIVSKDSLSGNGVKSIRLGDGR